MNTSKQTSLGSLPSTLLILLFLSGCATNREVILDSVEEITVYTNSGSVKVRAIIDTGARSSSIAKTFVEKYGLRPFIEDTVNEKCENGKVYVVNALGWECRTRVNLSFSLKGRLHETTATVSERNNLKTLVLIGRRDTVGKYIVRPISHDSIQEDDSEAEAEEEEKED